MYLCNKTGRECVQCKDSHLCIEMIVYSVSGDTKASPHVVLFPIEQLCCVKWPGYWLGAS